MRINYKVLQSNVSEDNLRPPHMEKDQEAFNCQANKKPAHALFRYNRPGSARKEYKRKENTCPGAALHLCSALWPAWGWLAGLWGLQPEWSRVCQAIHLPTQPWWCRGRAVETSTSPAFCWWRGAGVFSELLPKWGEQQGRPDCSWDQLEITIDENWVQCSRNLNKDSGEVSILWIPACSQCFHEGKILRSGQVSGEAVLQKTHQGRAEYDLAGWGGGGGGAASDPQMVEEHRACNTQRWFVGNQTKTHSFTKAPTCFPILPRLVSLNFIQVQRSLFTHSGRGLHSRLSGEWQGQTGDNFRHFLFFFFQKGTFPPPPS